MKNFYAKIAEVESGYQCKMCNFATALLLKAKTHAQTCGKLRRKIIRRKENKCTVMKLTNTERIFTSITENNIKRPSTNVQRV